MDSCQALTVSPQILVPVKAQQAIGHRRWQSMRCIRINLVLTTLTILAIWVTQRSASFPADRVPTHTASQGPLMRMGALPTEGELLLLTRWVSTGCRCL